jgi:hypothetical protein
VLTFQREHSWIVDKTKTHGIVMAQNIAAAVHAQTAVRWRMASAFPNPGHHFWQRRDVYARR